MFNRLRHLLTPPETKSSRTAKLLAFESGGKARWSPRNYPSLAREGYLANAIVHRSVRLIAENAAACSFLVFDGAAEREAHPLAQLLTRPNPRQDGGVFFEMLYAHLLLAGNAYIEAVALNTDVRELYALRPDRMKLVPGADGWAEAYEYSVGGRSVRFDQLSHRVPPILHLTFFHPLDDHYGLAPIEAAAVAVDQRDLPVTLDNAVHVGINTTASSPNLLSVKSNAALLSSIDVADGGSGDARLQISKESAAKTASVFFSNAFSGRAEFGLVGSDAFKLKVSADGSAWVEAFTIDQTTGNLALPRGLALTGVVAPAQITSNQNDYNPAGAATASVLQLTSDASRTVSGLAGGAEGRVVCVVNAGSQPIVLLDESTSSSAANRFALGANLNLAAKQAAILRYDGTAARWRALAGGMGFLAASNNLSDLANVATARANLSVREKLAANRTYFVRSDGSDGNTGLVNSAGGAFLTIQKAVDVCASMLDFAGFTVTISIGAGTFSGAVVLKAMVGMAGPVSLVINGAGSSTIVSTSGATCFAADGPTVQGIIRNLKVQTASSGYCFDVEGGASVRVGGIEFGSCAGSAHMLAFGVGSSLAVEAGNFTISGGCSAGYFVFATLGALIEASAGGTITLTGTPAFVAFAEAENATIRIGHNTFSGSATGKRFEASVNGVIYSSGAGASYLPGNAAGTTATGGQYV
jgi:hypothetical protein